MSRIPGTGSSLISNNNKDLFSATNKVINNASIKTDSSANSKNILNIDFENILGEEIELFLDRLDTYDGLFSTSQIQSIDFSRLENHVFFDIATSKIEYSFNKVINEYPYDGNEIDFKNFYSSIDGYTKYFIEEKYPKKLGCLKLNNEIYLKAKDTQGYLFKDFTKKSPQKKILNLKNDPFFFSLFALPDISSFAFSATGGYQSLSKKYVIFKKYDIASESGIVLYVDKIKKETISSIDYYFLNINFLIASENVNNKAIFTVENVQFNTEEFINIAVNISNVESTNNTDLYLKEAIFYINGERISSSNVVKSGLYWSEIEFSEGFTNEDFFIGRENNFEFKIIDSNNNITNIESLDISNFIGRIDEIRFYNKNIKEKQIISKKDESVFSEKGMLLYYKFNEPSGEHTNNAVCLDSSGNKLHCLIYDYNNNTIISNSSNYRDNQKSGVKYEKLEFSPVVIPSYPGISDKRTELLQEASEYDKVNPNSISKLIPKHFLALGSDLEFTSIYSSFDTSLNIDNEKRLSKLKANQNLINILCIWARFFDDIKLRIDIITDLLDVDYDNIRKNNAVSFLLPLLCKISGFQFKEVMPSAIKSKIDRKIPVTFQEIANYKNLRQVQNDLWKRLLINSQDYLKSKGTIKSIKNLFNSFGIDSDNFVNIREFSENNKINLGKNFKVKKSNYSIIDFNSFYGISQTINNSGIYSGLYRRPYINFENLSLKKNNNQLQKGLPDVFTIELFFDFNINYIDKTNIKQTLLTFFIKDDANQGTQNYPVLSLFLKRDNFKKEIFDLVLEFVPLISANGNAKITTIIEGISLNGPFLSTVTIKKENDSVYNKISYLPCGNFSSGVYLKPKESKENINTSTNYSLDTTANDKIDLFIGNYKSEYIVNNQNYESTSITAANLDIGFSKIRFWEKDLNDKEIIQHAKDPENIGLDNFDFKNKLLLNCNVEKDATFTESYVNSAYSYNYKFKSNNNVFENDITNKEIIYNPISQINQEVLNAASFKNKKINARAISLKIDEPKIDNRVNIISLEEEKNKYIENNFYDSPSYTLPNDWSKNTDARVSIEMSNVKHLNEDISKLISSINYYNRDITKSSSMYDYQYFKINEYRKSYFKRLEKEINHDVILNVFKYFDNILEDLINEAIPSKIKNLGFNYVYESHALERHKYEYKMSDSRIEIIDPRAFYNKSYDYKMSWRSEDYNRNRIQNKNN